MPKTSGLESQEDSYIFYSAGLESLLPSGPGAHDQRLSFSAVIDAGGEMYTLPVDSLEGTDMGHRMTVRLVAHHDKFLDFMMNDARVSVIFMGQHRPATIDKIDLKRGLETAHLTILRN
jgi:hypothetical protein